jgi:hypothetical protein
MRFGRLPHDVAAVAAAPSIVSHTFAVMAPPPTLLRAYVTYQPQMRQNDTLPDCTVAGLINAALAISALNTGAPLAIADDVEIPFYAAVAGCAPTVAAVAATDGLQVLDVMRRQGVYGFDIGQDAPLTADFASIPVNDRAALANGMALLGCGYWGIDVYERDMQTPPDQPWDDDGTDPGQLVGGHLICAWSYTGLGDTDTGMVATWGRLQPFTWRWAQARLREAYGLFWRQLQRADGTDWNGIDADRLRAENLRWAA